MPERSETTLKDQYATQVATHLERNENEQERIKSEAEALQARLAELQAEHAMLLNMQEVLKSRASAPNSDTRPTPDDGATTAEATKRATVPRARRSKEAGAGTGKRKRTAAPAKVGRKPKDGGRSTFRELVTAYLSQQHQPRPVSELTTELEKAHPDRAVNAPVVRNALEDAVARGKAERTKQGRSVYYTAVRAEPTGEPPTAQPVAVEA